jgi:hypothetical protein
VASRVPDDQYRGLLSKECIENGDGCAEGITILYVERDRTFKLHKRSKLTLILKITVKSITVKAI